MRTKNLNLCVEFLRDGLSLKQIAGQLGVSVPRVSQILYKAKRLGLVKKVGYGVWEVDDKQLKLMSGDGKSFVWEKDLTCFNFGKVKVDSVRVHGFMFRIALRSKKVWVREELPPNLELLKALPRINSWSFRFRHNLVWLTPKSVIVWLNKSFFSKLPEAGNKYAINDFLEFVRALENLLSVKLFIGSELKFRVCRSHFALVKNALANQLNAEGQPLRVIDRGDCWLIVDDSLKLGELEAISTQVLPSGHAVRALPDSQIIQDFFNSLRKEPFTANEIVELRQGMRAILLEFGALVEQLKREKRL